MTAKTSKRNILPTALAIVYTIVMVALGYNAVGLLPAFVFTFGYVGGLLLWSLIQGYVPFQKIRLIYFVVLVLFVVHKIEERQMGFFAALSTITKVPVPASTSPAAILLYAGAMVWLLIPFLVKKQSAFGYYLCWTFFAAMGISELAHFVFPFFSDKSYGYFPGMWSVIPLAPAAWYGMYLLYKKGYG